MLNPQGAVIEIVERRVAAMESPGCDIVVPDEVRINGQALLCPADHPIKVHEVELGPGGPVLVTLTLFAKRLTVCAEEPEPVPEPVDPRLAKIWQQPAGGGGRD